MKKDRSWSALIISILITMIIIVIALYLLEKIVPFSRDIKGIENGNISYYRANTALNEALLSMSGSDPSIQGSSTTLANGSGTAYQITAMGTKLPISGYGNSEYDTNWATLAPGRSIQLILSSGINWADVGTYFTFRVPDINKDGLWTETLSGWIALPIVNWTLSASGETLQASGSQIMANIASSGSVSFNGQPWLTLSGSSYTFNSFYAAKCISINCTLKLSLINPLILTTGEVVPYLEYQANFNVSTPLQTAIVETQGYMGGFRKNLTRFIQQTTTNEALDFTVFQ